MTRPASALPAQHPSSATEHAGVAGEAVDPAQARPGELRLIRSGWQVLVVDGEPAVHQATRLALAGTEALGRPLQLLHALSGEAACQLLRSNPEVALVLLGLAMAHGSSGLAFVRCVREELGQRAVRIVLRGGQEGRAGPAAERRLMVEHDLSDCSENAGRTANRLFGTVVAGLRSYRGIRALERTRAGMPAIARACAALGAARDTRRFASEALRELAALPFFHAAAFFDVTGPDAGLPQVSRAIRPQVLARLGPLQPQAELDLPPTLLAHARALPRLLVTEGDWHACCLRGEGGRRAVLALRARGVLGEDERDWLDLFVHHLAIALDRVQLAREPATAARLPGELPGPPLRVGEAGVSLCANEASHGLLDGCCAWAAGPAE
ncbi:MAG TPA: DUF3369 domain-containing protein [Ideonella sp.]|nr:DUF3369 domain-containing protein [Ideonella sp.]